MSECRWCDDGLQAICGHIAVSEEQRRQWAQNRDEAEARYQKHLRLGPEWCGCSVCFRIRESRDAGGVA